MDSNSRVGASSSTTKMCSFIGFIFFQSMPRNASRTLAVTDRCPPMLLAAKRLKSILRRSAHRARRPPRATDRFQDGRRAGAEPRGHLWLLDDEPLHPVARYCFADPKCFAHPKDGRIGFPRLRIIVIDHIFLAVAIKQ